MNRRPRVFLYDASSARRDTAGETAKQLFLSASWALGSRLMRGAAIGADDWDEAYALLEEHQDRHGPIRELQVWGHGSRGNPAIGRGPRLDVDAFARVVPSLRVVWWRSCSVHRDKDWTLRLVERTGATSVGHCEVITWPNPLRQRSCCALRPGEAPWWWRDGEGRWVHRTTRVPLPSVGTLRTRVPYGVDGVWRTPPAD